MSRATSARSRAGSLRAHAAARQAVDAALAQPGDIFHRAQEALTAYFGGLMAEIAASPHGPELFDANLELVGSVVRDTRAAVHASLAAALAQADTDGEIDLAAADATGDELAAVLLATGDGLKQDTLAAIPLATGIALQLRALRSGIARRDRRQSPPHSPAAGPQPGSRAAAAAPTLPAPPPEP